MTNQRKEDLMNRRLAKAVVTTFRDDSAESLRGLFALFDEREWLCSKEWLHTSGLALYFLARARKLGIEDVIPMHLLREMERSHAENRVRTEDLFNEFAIINIEFQRAKLSYANLKGFSLVPRFCHDPSYRYQHDLVFLVSPYDAERCRQVVERLGYRLKREYDGSWEFVAGNPEVLSLKDLYRVRTERSLEIHFVSARELSKSDGYEDRLARLQLQVWSGLEFPALSECDKLLGQAQHLFRHLQSEWTRTAWMFEFASAIRSYEEDTAFWAETVALIHKMPQGWTGIGVASLIASRAFGTVLPASLLFSTVNRLPQRVRLWADCYQDDVVYSEHPGSKLYLLLQDALSQGDSDLQTQRRRKLFPLHLPPRVATAAQENDLLARWKVIRAQVRFIWKRLRFHMTECLRYKIEAARWKKLVADSRT